MLLQITDWGELYINSINCNGIHGVDFYKNIKTNEIIKILDYIKLDKIAKKDYKVFKHIGIKQEIKDDVWTFCLFTSKKVMYMNSLMFMNLELTSNIHQYINYPLIVNNKTLCEYFIFHDNLNEFPKYCIKSIDVSNNIEIIFKNTLELYIDSIHGYRKALFGYNFNNPNVILDSIYKQYINKNNFLIENKLQYGKDVEYLRYLGLTNTDIINFVNNILENKNIHGVNIINEEKIWEMIKESLKK